MPIVSNPLQPPDARQVSIGGLPNHHDDASSRSTSAYSTYPPSAYPAMQMPVLPQPSMYPSMLGNIPFNHETLKLRLPTDQMQMIINAFNAPKQQATDVSMSTLSHLYAAHTLHRQPCHLHHCHIA